MKNLLRNCLRKFGYDIVPYPEVSADDRLILRQVAPYTMTSRERQIALIDAVRYVVRRRIPGCFVECGVWRGGSSMAMALALAQEGDVDRDLYLFDTFEGMSAPTDADKTTDGMPAATQLSRAKKGTGVWCEAGIDDVQANLASTNYPAGRLHLVKGPVEQTIPSQAPAGPIALLRLDTDWYESTRHEMIHLFPLLQEGGVLIIDDYGHWQGARRAIDEFMKTQPRPYLLQRIDYTGRLLLKS